MSQNVVIVLSLLADPADILFEFLDNSLCLDQLCHVDLVGVAFLGSPVEPLQLRTFAVLVETTEWSATAAALSGEQLDRLQAWPIDPVRFLLWLEEGLGHAEIEPEWTVCLKQEWEDNREHLCQAAQVAKQLYNVEIFVLQFHHATIDSEIYLQELPDITNLTAALKEASFFNPA